MSLMWVVDENAKRDSLARMEKNKKKEEKWGKVNVSYVKDGNNTIVTITGNYFAQGIIQAITAVEPDICNCCCYSCELGCHADCESDGQSCYNNGYNRVNDGIHQGQVVSKSEN
jgi:hypothetical protein